MLFYLGLGLASGLLSGLLGIGGGIIIVPLLYWQFGSLGFPPGLLMVMAVATSLATIMPTSVSSGLAHHRRGYVHWPHALRMAPGIVLGAVAGSSLVGGVSATCVKALVALFQIVVAYTLLKPATRPSSATPKTPTRRGIVLAGCLTGFLSSMVGIGGGTLSVPFLLYLGLGARQAVATSSVSGFPIALSSTLTYVITGWQHPDLPAWNLGYVHLPAALLIAGASITTAPLGAGLAHRLPTDRLKKILGVLAGMVGMKLAGDVLTAALFPF